MRMYERLASDAIERPAEKLGIRNDLDDPEPALIAAVERAVATLLSHQRASNQEDAG